MISIFVLPILAAATVTEPRWQAVTDWGCRLTPKNGEAFTLLGQVSKKIDPRNPNVHERDQTALIILSDTSGRFKGKGARGLALRNPKPGEYWVSLDATHGLILNFSRRASENKAELIDNAAGKPVASGPCETRPAKGQSS